MTGGDVVIKRVFDLTVALLLIFLLSPIIIAVALVIRLKLGSPVIFKQQRPGYMGRPFHIYKFRSMTDECDAFGKLLPDEKRLPPFGLWLRSVSLDELPQLFNIVRGELSLVGPRPLMMDYLPRYSPEQARRHDVMPGVTGWAQINGRNAISWTEKFKLDVWYVDNRSFFLDLKILWLTLEKVLRRADINQAGRATVEEFMGSEKESEKEKNYEL